MPFFYFDPNYMLAIAPAVLLAMWAQGRVHASFAAAAQEPAPLSGAAAARYILDSAGATDVAIERIPGTLNDHYDPQAKVLRLSEGVYGARSLAAVGIAAHEAGHALQDAQGPFDKIPVILVLCGKIPPTTCTITYLRPRLLALTNIPIAKLGETLGVHFPR